VDRSLALGGIFVMLGLSACSSTIGSTCTQSTDCSTQGNRVCDTSQPNGYCTVFGCGDKTCPDQAVCVTFAVALPGCAYNDYEAPDRTSRTLCLAHCQQDSDCRTSDGYVCADPKGPPWSARIVDDNQNQSVCIVAATPVDSGPMPPPAICNAGRPVPEAGTGGEADTGATDAANADGGGSDAGDAG
jgi:hypothetical protein